MLKLKRDETSFRANQKRARRCDRSKARILDLIFNLISFFKFKFCEIKKFVLCLIIFIFNGKFEWNFPNFYMIFISRIPNLGREKSNANSERAQKAKEVGKENRRWSHTKYAAIYSIQEIRFHIQQAFVRSGCRILTEFFLFFLFIICLSFFYLCIMYSFTFMNSLSVRNVNERRKRNWYPKENRKEIETLNSEFQNFFLFCFCFGWSCLCQFSSHTWTGFYFDSFSNLKQQKVPFQEENLSLLICQRIFQI